MASQATAGEIPAFDQWLNTDLFAPSQQPPAVSIEGEGSDDLVNGLNYADLFADLNKPQLQQPTASMPEPDLPFAPESQPDTFTADSFSPSVFEPATFPGSPIDGLSPVSDDSASRRLGSMSPISFDRLDVTSQPPNDSFSLEPSAFTATQHTEQDQKPDITPAVADTASPASGSATGTKRSRRVRSLSAVAEDDGSEFGEDDSDFRASTSTSSRTSGRRQSKRVSKQPKISVSQFATKELHHTTAGTHLAPVPDWMDKPDPETYSKMTPAEKRQMRNKISARNFRHRKKEQMSHLEQEVADRDDIIKQLRDELGNMKSENTDLKSEVALLKQKWEEMVSKMTAASPSTSAVGLGVKVPSRSASTNEEWPLASPVSEGSPVASTSTAAPPSIALKPRSTNTLALPNLNKDVPPTLKRSAGSWTTQSFGGGFTSVHTTLLPDVAMPYSTQNFNPALNRLSREQEHNLPSFTSHLQPGFSAMQSGKPECTIDFFAGNPFSLRASQLDQHRAQLYGKLAHNLVGLSAAQKLASPADSNEATLPIPAGFRPAFFASPSQQRMDQSSLSDKARQQLSLSPSDSTPAQAALATQTALIAGYAQQTLFSRMTTAFVEAFAGTSEERRMGQMNADKVAAVLSGKAKLQVVSNDETTRHSDVDGLADQFANVDIASDRKRVSSPSPCRAFSLCNKWSRS